MIKSYYQKKELLVGNFKLMDKFSIVYDINLQAYIAYTLIAVAYESKLWIHCYG